MMPLDSRCNIFEAHLAVQQLVNWTEQELDADWCLDQFFGSCYVINLPHDHERLKKVTEELHKVSLKNFEIFRGCDGREELPPTIWRKMFSHWAKHDLHSSTGIGNLENQQKSESGCYMSHYRLIKEVHDKFNNALAHYTQMQSSGTPTDIVQAALQVKKYSSVLILEDDNGFGFVNRNQTTVSMIGCGLFLRFALTELPQDWDMLYFMAHSKEPAKRIGHFLYQINGTFCTNAYAVKYTMYDNLIQHLQKIEDPKVEMITPIDNMISELHHAHKCYAISPSLSYQRPGYSWVTSHFRQSFVQLQLKDR